MLLEIPDDILDQKEYTGTDLKLDVAVLLYQKKVITLARAARWVGMSRLSFQKILADRGIPLHYSLEDFETDLQSLKSMPR